MSIISNLPIIWNLGGRPGLYADIPVPVLQVPAGQEGGPGGLPNLMKQVPEKEHDGEEKKEDVGDEEEMERKRSDEESVTKIFFTTYEYRILIGFQKSPNTKYQIIFGIEKIKIPNIEYYSVSRSSKYQIRIVLFGLTIQIPNTKYQMVYKILEKN